MGGFMPLEQQTTDNSNPGLKKNSHAKGAREPNDERWTTNDKDKVTAPGGNPDPDDNSEENLSELKSRIAVLHRELVNLEAKLATCQDEQHEAFNHYVTLAYKTRKVTACVALCVMVLLLCVSTAILIKNALQISKAFAPGFLRGVKAILSGPYPPALKVAFGAALPLLIGVIVLGLYVTLGGHSRKKAHAAAIDALVEKHEACYKVQAKIAHGRLALQSAVVSVADASMQQLQFVQQGILMCVGELDDMQKFRTRLDNEISAINQRIPSIVEEVRKHTDDALEWNLARTKNILEGTEERLKDMGNELVRYLDDARALIENARIAAGSMQHLVGDEVRKQLAEVLVKVAEVSNGFIALKKSVSGYLEKSSGLVAREVRAILDDRMRSLRTMYKMWDAEQNSVVSVCTTLQKASMEAAAVASATSANAYRKIAESLSYEIADSSGKKNKFYVHQKIELMSKAIKEILDNATCKQPYDSNNKQHVTACRDVLRNLDCKLFGNKAVFADEVEYAAFIRKASEAVSAAEAEGTPLPDNMRRVKSFIEHHDGFFLYLPYLMTSAMAIDHMRSSVDQMTEVCTRLTSIVEEVSFDVRNSGAPSASTPPPSSKVTNATAHSGSTRALSAA
ncbi:hypothetical protein ACIS_00001 [Anaplasma centrale str. Israel]|uniref:Uncharacterized protein n=1 Tax=Anaplasma centrale (strain Israel) TaxID=574556 RepID=D1AT51_ANACI|nr:hypothetical protein ACIS_00001 [Anaplasma centrale str. Israel]